MLEQSNLPSMTLQDRWASSVEPSDLALRSQVLVDELKVRDAMHHEVHSARKAVRERLSEVVSDHGKRGLLGSRATLLVGIAVFEDEAKGLIASLVRTVSKHARSTGAFEQIRGAIDEYLSLFESELDVIFRTLGHDTQDSGRTQDFLETADMLWSEKRADLLDSLERHRSQFMSPMKEADQGLVAKQTCMLCSHWEPMSDAPDCHAGLCRKFALGSRNDGWSITVSTDGCEGWEGEGFFKGDDGAIHADRRTFARTRIDIPASLCTPAIEYPGRLTDISAMGARIELSPPPLQGTTALLKWGSFEFFCDVVWANKDACGLSFDKPLPNEALVETLGEVRAEVAPVADPTNIPAGQRRALPNDQNSASEPGNPERVRLWGLFGRRMT